MWLRGRGEINVGMCSCSHQGSDVGSKGLGKMQQDAGGRRSGQYGTWFRKNPWCSTTIPLITGCKQRIGFPWHAVVQ